MKFETYQFFLRKVLVLVEMTHIWAPREGRCSLFFELLRALSSRFTVQDFIRSLWILTGEHIFLGSNSILLFLLLISLNCSLFNYSFICCFIESYMLFFISEPPWGSSSSWMLGVDEGRGFGDLFSDIYFSDLVVPVPKSCLMRRLTRTEGLSFFLMLAVGSMSKQSLMDISAWLLGRFNSLLLIY